MADLDNAEQVGAATQELAYAKDAARHGLDPKLIWRCIISEAMGAKEDHERILTMYPLGTPNRPIKMIREAAHFRTKAEDRILSGLREIYDLLQDDCDALQRRANYLWTVDAELAVISAQIGRMERAAGQNDEVADLALSAVLSIRAMQKRIAEFTPPNNNAEALVVSEEEMK